MALRPLHRASRFFGSLRPGPPKKADVAWAADVLNPEELRLFNRMSNPDRRHSVAVARAVERALGAEATTPVLAAALLHDVGKSQAGLRTYGRVVATLSHAIVGDSFADHWRRTSGLTRRVGLYLQYPRIGAEMLELAGSDPLVVAWAREHHLPKEEWTVPAHLGQALSAADR